MELYTQVRGSGPPILLLHGLFGSLENLGIIARALADRFTVYAVDLRNHGRSPHGAPMDYPSLAADIAQTMDAHGLASASLLGHSMGGKAAMELALSYPERVDHLIAVDIAPVGYNARHDRELEAMLSLDPAGLNSRAEADTALAQTIPESAVRQFLLKNLVRSGSDGFIWRIPLRLLQSQYPAIAAAPTSSGPYPGRALFVRGGASDYVPTDAERAIHSMFPQAQIVTIPSARHWVHVDAHDKFLEAINRFLS